MHLSRPEESYAALEAEMLNSSGNTTNAEASELKDGGEELKEVVWTSDYGNGLGASRFQILL